MLTKFENALLQQTIEEKLENFTQYVIIDEHLEELLFSMLVDENIKNVFVFLAEVDKALSTKNLDKKHPLISDNLRINSQQTLNDLFVLFRMQPGPLTYELSITHSFHLNDESVKQFIQQIYFDFIKNGYQLVQHEIVQVVEEKKPMTTNNVFNQNESKLLKQNSQLSAEDIATLNYLLLDSETSPEDKKAVNELLSKHERNSSTILNSSEPKAPSFDEETAFLRFIVTDPDTSVEDKTKAQELLNKHDKPSPIKEMPKEFELILNDSTKSENISVAGNILIKGDVSGSGTIQSTNGCIHIMGSTRGYGKIVAKESIIIDKNVSNTGGLVSLAGGISIHGYIDNPGAITARDTITVDGDAVFSKIIASEKGSVYFGKNTDGYGSLNAFMDIVIAEHAKHSGGMTAKAGMIEIGKDLKDVGLVDVEKSLYVKGSINSPRSITSRGTIKVDGSTKGYCSLVAFDNINIIGSATHSGGMTSTRGSIEIGMDIIDVGVISAEKNILVQAGNINNSKAIRANGTIRVIGNTKGYCSLFAKNDIVIFGNAANSGGIESNGSITIEGNSTDVGVMSAAKGIVVKRDITNSKAISSGADLVVGGSTKGYCSLTALGNIKIKVDAMNSGGIESKTESIEIGGNLTDAGCVTAEKSIYVEGNVNNSKAIFAKKGAFSSNSTKGYCSITAYSAISIKTNAGNSGGIKSSAGAIVIEGCLDKDCGHVDASGDILIHGSKYSSRRLASSTGDITILGATINEPSQIKTAGKLITPNVVIKSDNKPSINSSVQSNTSRLATSRSDRYDATADGIIRLVNDAIFITDASELHVKSGFNVLQINNKGHKTLIMNGGLITGLVDEASVIYNNERLRPKNGTITVDGFCKVPERVNNYGFFSSSSNSIDDIFSQFGFKF